MASTYVPGEAGWSDNGTLGDAAKLRVKLTQVYHADTNSSTLTITLQSRCATLGGRFMLLDNALVKLGNATVFSGGGSGMSALNAWVDYAGDSAWHDLTDGASGQPLSWTAELPHDANGDATAALSVTARFYRDDSFYASFYDLSGSQSFHGDRVFTLTITAGRGSLVSVTRGGTPLSSGASITAGDVLTISFSVEGGYTLSEHKVNGQSFESGGTHTVAGDVSVTAAAQAGSFTLSVSAGAHSAIRVLRGAAEVSDGDVLTAGDVLAVFFSAEPGYELTERSLNGQSVSAEGMYTVRGPVSLRSAAAPICAALLDDGAAFLRCRLLLDTGSAFVPARLFLDRGDRWTELRV